MIKTFKLVHPTSHIMLTGVGIQGFGLQPKPFKNLSVGFHAPLHLNCFYLQHDTFEYHFEGMVADASFSTG